MSEAARRAGMLRDIVVKLGTSHKAAARPSHPVRVILVKAQPHRKRGGRKGKDGRLPQRRHPADRDQPARRAGRNHRRYL